MSFLAIIDALSALKHHPDTAVNATHSKSFQEISEAWAVLSRSELRNEYDAAKGHKKYTTHAAPAVNSESLSHIRTNYESSMSARGKPMMSSNKYRHEAWQKIPLDQKKVSSFSVYFFCCCVFIIVLICIL